MGKQSEKKNRENTQKDMGNKEASEIDNGGEMEREMTRMV